MLRPSQPTFHLSPSLAITRTTMGLTVMGRYSRQELLEGWTPSEEEAGRMRETLLGSCKPKREKEEEEEDCEEVKRKEIEEALTVRVCELKDEGRLKLKEYCCKSSER